MSQVKLSSKALAFGCVLLAVFAAGCSKMNDTVFDPDTGHPGDFLATHPAAYQTSGGACTGCHGGELLGGISGVSCYSASRDGQACHPGGPGGHPAGWRSLHTASDPAQAATCAICHQSNAGTPGCFNNTLCHGAESNHPAGWRTAHQSTNQSDAAGCAECHPDKGTPSCFSASACHAGGNHPADWEDSHQNTSQSQASTCAQCHQSQAGTPGCFNNTLCHGEEDD